ncbi:MAG TPA: biopolymer transporter ExbD [Tepidisphaeraceae bacterium]|jgi:biopolymer transport protein ExbD|nr:biopolymer transporter ExbD [Tepidisphaeraceae bacterium]
MKKHSMPEMKEGGVNVTPLIDIVMCLIIFFMLVAKIGVARGVDKDIKLPNALLGKVIKDMGTTLTLNVHHMPSGDPQVTAMVGDKAKEVKITDGTDTPLLRVLKEFKRTHEAKAVVIIRGDQNLDYGQLEMVLMAIATAGITDTAYETKEGTVAPPEAHSAAPVAAAQ